MADSESARPGVRHLVVEEDYAGQRLDNFLQRELKGVPRTRLYKALRKGEIRVNKGRVKPDYRLRAGDSVRLPPLRTPSPADPALIPRHWMERIDSNIVYEDKSLLVLDKPSGLAVHGGSGLNYGLIECLRQMRPQDRYLELVHRLDRDTSGLILVARRPALLRELHRQLRGDEVDKRYLALVAGKWPAALSRVEAPLQKNVLRSGERMVKVDRDGKPSVTEFSVIERFDGATLVQAKPVTGRTHQIRVHALHAGYPLLGDAKYGSAGGEELGRQLGLKRLFLHASDLRLNLPESGPLALHAALDSELNQILDNIRR